MWGTLISPSRLKSLVVSLIIVERITNNDMA